MNAARASTTRWLLITSLTVAHLALAEAGAAEVLPDVPGAYFSDPADVVSSPVERQLNQRLEDYERESSNQLMVAVFDRMQSSSSIEDYTVRLAQKWAVGQEGRNNGAVLFVFVHDRKMFLQVGYGLEASLTDFEAKRIVDGLRDYFRKGDFDGGFVWAVDGMIKATIGEFEGDGTTRAEHVKRTRHFVLIVLLFFVPFAILFILAHVMKPGRTYTKGGRTVYWGHGGGSGGSRGGWGGGGSFGGFSGGGGSFGGGGAGGGW